MDLEAQADSVSYTYQCPSCKKIRLIKPKDYIVSDELIDIDTPSGKRTVHKDMCDYCINKTINKYFKPKKEDIKKVINQQELGGKSLEEIL